MLQAKSYNEAETISLISDGNEAAFAKFFEYYRDRIYSIAFKFTHSATAAEEITADVFLKIWLKRKDLGNIQNFSAYFFTITRNEVYRAFKLNAKKYRIAELTELDVVSTACDAEDYLMEKEYNSLLQKAIDGLTARQRQVYQLSKEKHLGREAIATQLHLQPETVKFHMAQAIKNIRSFCLLHLKSFFWIIILLRRF
ncbi:MAG TPA: sigma-70 family RNA polymerase sigma factor [Hanamia sp.]|nr:sigma-70 family RNA polymerase sigma factor [Hanamia sp.]